eukprot:scaffold48237_cov29-Tisochrysis_lutea.AAC.2
MELSVRLECVGAALTKGWDKGSRATHEALPWHAEEIAPLGTGRSCEKQREGHGGGGAGEGERHGGGGGEGKEGKGEARRGQAVGGREEGMEEGV